MSRRSLALETLGQLLPMPRNLAGASHLVVSALASALLAIGLATAIPNWHLTDLKAYLAAAELLATGGNPFDLHLIERGLPYHYHYSPWFAAVLVPATALPSELVRVAWSVMLIAASVAALGSVLRSHGTRSIPFVLLMAFLLLNLVAEGNVQPLLLAGLVWTLEHKWGPVAIGVAASLKIAPILLALVYVGRGEWKKAGLAAGVAAVLIAPLLLFEITPAALQTGNTGLFTTAPIAWAIGVIVGIGITLAVARSRYGWLAASTSTVLALPRLLVFDVTNLIAALPRPTGDGPRD